MAADSRYCSDVGCDAVFRFVYPLRKVGLNKSTSRLRRGYGWGKQSVTHGRCSDTLVRENGRWVFLGWSCSDEPKRD
jgi:hypothetical protein